MFTVSLLNWKRKKNAIQIINKLISFELIDEIIVSNGNIKTAITPEDYNQTDKVKLFDDSEYNNIYGLELRFLNGIRAKNENIVIMDDDILVNEIDFNMLVDLYKNDKDRIIGIFGRNIEKEYDPIHRYGEVDMALTRLLLVQKKMCKLFFVCKPLIEDFYKKGIPYGNGEDIFFSFIANIYFNKKTYCLKTKIENLDHCDCAISGTANHSSYRNELCIELSKRRLLIENFIKNINL